MDHQPPLGTAVPTPPGRTCCTPRVPSRAPSPAPVGLYRVHGLERDVLGRANLDRCDTLWVNLRGLGSDFDDLTCDVASALGWEPPAHADLGELLTSAATVVDAAPWATVRRLAVDAFFARYDDDCVEPAQVDWRTPDEAADDVQFLPDGTCRLCGVDGVDDPSLPGGDVPPHPAYRAEVHADVAGMVACGQVSWQQVLDTVAAALARP